jgi:protein tyrosine/serine phosphatase
LGRVLLRGCFAGVVLALSVHAGYVLLGPNFHTVIPGAVYRCAQPSGARLVELVQKWKIRTVVNLRGCCDPLPWYLEQCETSNRLNLSQEDLSFSAGRLPSSVTIRELVDVLDHSDYPILFHCHKGADRSGMASAIALLLQTNTPLEEARRQLTPRYGHLPLGKTGNIDRFFDLYAEWLREMGLQHSNAVFRHWIEHAYCPGEGRCRFEVLGPAARPVHVPFGEPFAIRVRVYNTSVKPWRFRPGTHAGIHAWFVLYNADDQDVAEGRAGMFHATVPPGEHIDLTLALPAQYQSGRYRLRVDMRDEQHASFGQVGSEPLVLEVEVP